MSEKNEAIKKGKGMIAEFKEFIAQGNVLDLAVGVIIGGAFGKIVTSIVNDILMPLIGILLGGVDFTGLTLKIKDATINYGVFIQNIIDFLIVAACIFLIVKAVNKITRRGKAEEEAEEEKDPQIALLEEIRDAIKDKHAVK